MGRAMVLDKPIGSVFRAVYMPCRGIRPPLFHCRGISTVWFRIKKKIASVKHTYKIELN